MALTNLQKATLYVRHHQRNIQALVAIILATNAERQAIFDAWLAEQKARLQEQRTVTQAEIDALNAIIVEIP